MENTTERKKTVFSGIQPTGTPTLGNYLGALRNWKSMSEDYDCLFSVVDLHAITMATFRENPAALRANTLELYALLLAIGIDPEKNIVFVQSHAPTHSQMQWLLSCYTQYGEALRMTQFKDKSRKAGSDVTVGLLTYPVLMAGDILLYNADSVPVGADQKQHLEITRDIAMRFNSIYGDFFTVPEPFIGKAGAKVMSLTDPKAKMNKSDGNERSYISMLDEPNVIVKKIKSAVTDSEAVVVRKKGKDGINNLLEIYSVCTGKSLSAIENEFAGKGYGEFKSAVAEAVVEELRPIQERYKQYVKEKTYLTDCMRSNAEKAARRSQRTLDKAMKKIGFLQV